MAKCDLMVMTYNIGLSQQQVDTIVDLGRTPHARPRNSSEVDKRKKVRHSLTSMSLLLTEHQPDIMVVQEVGGHEEGLQPRDLPDFIDFIENMWSSAPFPGERPLAMYEMHSDKSYLCFARKGRAQVLGTDVFKLVRDIPEQTWRDAQLVDIMVTPQASGAAHTRPPPGGSPPSSAGTRVRIVNAHFVSGRKAHSSGHDHSLNFQTRLECLQNATKAAVAERQGHKPAVSLVAGDFNIDSDGILLAKFGHALERNHAWCINDRASHKDFILSTGADVRSTIPRSRWRDADALRVKPGGAHWPIAMTFSWQPADLPTLPPSANPGSSLVKRAKQLVEEAEQQASAIVITIWAFCRLVWAFC